MGTVDEERDGLMEVKYFFNVLLLSISLATIFMTLVTYIIFKFRYSMKSQSSDGTVDLEGSFFRRYAPHIARKNSEIRAAKDLKKLSPKQRRKKLVWTYGGVTLIIFTFFLLENHLSFRRELMERVSEAKRYKSLLQQGLLSKKDFNSNYKYNEITETEPADLKFYREQAVAQLKNQNIYLVKLSNNTGEYTHDTAIKSWINFFKRNKIKWNYSGTTMKEGALYILPQLNILSDNQYKKISKYIDNPNIRILATGPLGRFNTNKKRREAWLGENVSRLVINENPKDFFRQSSKVLDQYLPELG